MAATQRDALLDGLGELFKDAILCDVTLQAEDTKVAAHKCVLAASSSYFRAMFTFDPSERIQQEVTLHDVPGYVLEALVNYLYTGHITLTETNVQQLVTAAEMMGITCLRTQCESFMSTAVCKENCVEIYNFADFQNLNTLRICAEKCIQQHFQDVCTTDAFLKLKLTNLIRLIKSDDLNVSGEEIVFDSVLRWLKYDLDNREDDFLVLSCSIRFNLMNPEYLRNSMSSEAILRDDVLSDFLTQELTNLADKESEFGQLRHKSNPRLGMCVKEMLIFSGGAHCPTDRAFGCFDPETKENFFTIKHHPTFDFKNKLELYRLVVTESGDIIILGGVLYDDYHFDLSGAEAQSTVMMYNQRCAAWEECASMKLPKCAFGTCCRLDRIYVFGGYIMYPGHSPTKDVSVYDVSDDSWSLCDDMPIKMAHQAVALHKDMAYVFGGMGEDSENQCLKSVYQYNFAIDQWTTVSVEMPRPQAEAVAISHKDKIYILGGHNAAGNILSLLTFDPERVRWSYGEEFPDDRMFTSVTKGCDCIYVCGGSRLSMARWGTSRRSKTVETKDLFRYDITDNTWTKVARFVEYGNNYTCGFAKVNARHLRKSDYEEEEI